MNHLFVDNLTVIDFAYLDPTRGLVGESWIADVVLGGELDEQGMVFDFSNVKRTIKRVIDERVDHRLVIPRGYQGLSWNEEEPDTFNWSLTDGSQITHRSPDEAIVWLSADRVVPSAVASLLEQEIKAVLPANVISVEINLREEEIDGAYYHYTHGLRKHDGACQRIAHGHRSRLVLELDGQRQPDWEREIALAWTDIYLGVAEDISARANGRIRFAYDAPEGHFELALPEHCVDLLETDSTVECIAATLQQRLYQHKGLATTRRVRVRAFEGVDKGAIADGG